MSIVDEHSHYQQLESFESSELAIEDYLQERRKNKGFVHSALAAYEDRAILMNEGVPNDLE